MERTGKTTREAARLFQEIIDHCQAADTVTRAQLGLNITDFKALKLLCEHGDFGPGQLAAELEISSAATTMVLDRLETRGYVTRTLHPTDRRRSSIAVNTEVIEDPFIAARALLRDADAALGKMPEAAREQLLIFLQDLSSRMQRTLLQLPSPSPHQRNDQK